MGGEPDKHNSLEGRLIDSESLIEDLFKYFSPEGIPVPCHESKTMLIFDIMTEHVKRKEKFFGYIDDMIQEENEGVYNYIERRTDKVHRATKNFQYAETSRQEMQLFYLLLSYNPHTHEREPQLLPKIDQDTVIRVEKDFSKEDTALIELYDTLMGSLESENNGAYRYINYMIDSTRPEFKLYTQGSLIKLYELLRNEKEHSIFNGEELH